MVILAVLVYMIIYDSTASSSQVHVVVHLSYFPALNTYKSLSFSTQMLLWQDRKIKMQIEGPAWFYLSKGVIEGGFRGLFVRLFDIEQFHWQDEFCMSMYMHDEPRQFSA